MKKIKPIFMIHKHHASKLHYDLRLEIDGKLKSWAMYTLPLNPQKPITATQVADHPFWYRHFEGVIPEGQYGAGPVIVWEKGLYTTFYHNHDGKILTPSECLENGLLLLWLEGHKLKGGYILLRITKKAKWLFIKMKDKYTKSNKKNWSKSVKSGKSIEQILNEYLEKHKEKK